MDVYRTNYTLCDFSLASQTVFARTTINPDIGELFKYLTVIQGRFGGSDCKQIYGYEVGCLGYTLYCQLTHHGYECVIPAPMTMPSTAKEIKTDKRYALKIAKCLAYRIYSPVYVLSDEDNAVREYIRMRDGAQTLLKQTKQQINALCRHGRVFDGQSCWTQKHLKWIAT